MASYEKYETAKGIKWLLRTTLTDPLTKEKRRTTRRGFDKLSDAKFAAKQLELEESNLKRNVKAHYLFKDIFQEFQNDYSKHLKPSTIYRKSVDFNKWILPYFGDKRLKDISKKDCQEYIDFMSKQIKAYRPIIIQARNVFDYAIKNDYIESSPFDNTVYPKNTLFEEKEQLVPFWNREQSMHFLSSLEEHESLKRYAIFRTLLVTGLRKGELLALQEADLDLTTQTLSIQKTLFYDEDGHHQLLKPKTKSSIRSLHLDDITFQLLLNLMDQNMEQRKLLGVNDQDDQERFLFIKETLIEPFRNSYVNELLNKMCKKYNLPRITVHGLRHSCASLLFAAGADIKVVQKLLGHAHIETTFNIYTHVTEEQVEKTTDLLIDFLNKKSSCAQNVPKP